MCCVRTLGYSRLGNPLYCLDFGRWHGLRRVGESRKDVPGGDTIVINQLSNLTQQYTHSFQAKFLAKLAFGGSQGRLVGAIELTAWQLPVGWVVCLGQHQEPRRVLGIKNNY